VYENKANELYAADSGVDDATWQIKYDHLGTLFTSPAYKAYDYSTAWNYNLPEQVNTKGVDVTIQNVWVPQNIPVPSEAEANAIIEAEKLVVTSSSIGTSCKIKVTYTPEAQEDLMVETLGIWLPRGFSYVEGSSNLEADPLAEYYAEPVIESHGGNQAVLWTFNSVPFIDLPSVNPADSPMVAEVTFQFTSSEPLAKPAAVAWITTSGVPDIPYSWDADVKVFKITSQADNSTVEAYIAKEEIRRLRSSIAGDYQALGNSLMKDTNSDNKRDQWLTSSNATVDDIPLDAEVGAAFLYWSAWRAESSKQTVFSDNCTSFNNWNNGSVWSVYNNYFRGHYSSGDYTARLLTLINNQNLDSYLSGTVAVSWDQWVSPLSDLFSDSCSNFNNWNNGSAWSVYYNYFRGHYSSGGDTARLLTLKNSQNLSSYATGAVTVSWDQRVSPLSDLFSDSCSSFYNWNNGSAWSVYYNRFRGHYSSGGDTARLLTLKNSQNLSSYATGAVTVSWDQWVSGTPGADDGLDFAFSADGGTTWSDNIQAFRGNIGSSAVDFSYTIPSQYLTASFKMRFYLVGFGGSGQYCNLDNIKITPSYSEADGLDFAFSADGGNTWSDNIQAFRGNIGSSAVDFSYTIPSQYLTASFKMRFYLVGCSGSGQYCNLDNIKITPSYSGADGLDFAFSADGGNTWSNNIQAFRGNIGSSAVDFSYTIPSQYLTTSFKMRFDLVGCSASGQYCNLDNIIISVMTPDTSAVFKIDGNQVYFDGDGMPQQGTQPLTADRLQVLPNYNSNGSPNGFSYSCYKDVTSLVKTFSAKAPDPATNHPGNGTYTTGDVLGDTGNEWSYAAWSLIIVYSSAETQGHQLYLYDKFFYADMDTNIDFDKDGQPGGHISGFIVPRRIGDEVNAAKLTVCVGEGDECYDNDSLIFKGTALSNAQSPWDNVWNSKSPGVSNDGIDIDTFDITWASGLLEEGDTSVQIDLPTETDSWNLVYMILSFRSQTTTGGALSYLIQ